MRTDSNGSRDTADAGLWRQIGVSAFAKLPPGARRSLLHAVGKYAPWEEGFDPTPPPAGTDEVTGPPDFVGIGAQKAGTTWWYEAICEHPNVFVRQDIHKERHFFARYVTQPFGPAECMRYHDWFPRPSGSLTGEWTPDYLHLPWVPPLLAYASPGTRLLVLLRDPVNRFLSGLAHQHRDRGSLPAEAYEDAVMRGFYDLALNRWTKYFPLEQILVLQYERCVADPVGQLARTYEFLGLEPVVVDEIEGRVNATTRSVDLKQDVLRRLTELYAPDVRALSSRFSELDLTLWPHFRDISGQ